MLVMSGTLSSVDKQVLSSNSTISISSVLPSMATSPSSRLTSSMLVMSGTFSSGSSNKSNSSSSPDFNLLDVKLSNNNDFLLSWELCSSSNKFRICEALSKTASSNWTGSASPSTFTSPSSTVSIVTESSSSTRTSLSSKYEDKLGSSNGFSSSTFSSVSSLILIFRLFNRKTLG